MDYIEKNNEPFVEPLLRFSNANGDVLRGVRKGDKGYSSFEEAYASYVKSGAVKGWKKHNKMTLNLFVPLGDITFYIFNESQNKKYSYTIGESNYSRLVIPPDYWVAFSGKAPFDSLLINIADYLHDPHEFSVCELDKFGYRDLS